MLDVLGEDAFIKRAFIKEYPHTFTGTEKTILSIYSDKKKRKINDFLNNYIPAKMISSGVNYAIFNTIEGISEIAEAMRSHKECFKDIDFIMGIDIIKGVASLRSINDNCDVSKIAVQNGGGGHCKAAGFSIDKELQSVFLSNILK